MEQNQIVLEEERGITLSDIFFLIKKNILMIIIITAVLTIAGGIYGLKFKKITYTAKAEAIVMADSSSASAQANYQEYVTSTYLINTFNSFIVSNKVVGVVQENLTAALEAYKTENPDAELPDDYKSLSDSKKKNNVIKTIQENTSVSTTTNSLIITVKYKSSNEVLSIVVANLLIEKTKEIADGYVEVGGEKQYNFKMLAGNFEFVDRAETSTVTASRGATMVIVICALVGLVISFAIILIKYLVDDTYTSKETFERTFNINVLTLLPDVTRIEEKGGKK